MPTVHELMLPDEQRTVCACALCEEGRFMKRIVDLLPEADANDLNDWYNAVRDSGEQRAMTLHHLHESLEKCVEYVGDLQK